jgi:hypothetical protein
MKIRRLVLKVVHISPSLGRVLGNPYWEGEGKLPAYDLCGCGYKQLGAYLIVDNLLRETPLFPLACRL